MAITDSLLVLLGIHEPGPIIIFFLSSMSDSFQHFRSTQSQPQPIPFSEDSFDELERMIQRLRQLQKSDFDFRVKPPLFPIQISQNKALSPKDYDNNETLEQTYCHQVAEGLQHPSAAGQKKPTTPKRYHTEHYEGEDGGEKQIISVKVERKSLIAELPKDKKQQTRVIIKKLSMISAKLMTRQLPVSRATRLLQVIDQLQQMVDSL